MEILNRILGEIKITFLHFKERSKNKYYGDRFEEWVVKSSNISKDGSNNSNFWKLLEWRGDKYIEGYRPLSSSSPDLLMECISDKSVFYTSQERIAVECKWRSKKNFFLDGTLPVTPHVEDTLSQRRLHIGRAIKGKSGCWIVM